MSKEQDGENLTCIIKFRPAISTELLQWAILSFFQCLYGDSYPGEFIT